MRLITNFTEFLNESLIKDEKIEKDLERIHFLKKRLKEIEKETKQIEADLKEFDVAVRPIFETMRELDEKIAITENFVITITRNAHTRVDTGWKTVVEKSLEQVDDAARDIIKSLIESNKKLVDIKFSFEIERLDEGINLTKFKDIISRSIDKFMGIFKKKISAVDSANAKLAKLAADSKEWSDGSGY